MILVDATHVRSPNVTGIERITIDLFSPENLSPLPVRAVTSSGGLSLIARQQAMLPWLLARDRRSILVCPGFPPAPGLLPFRGRVAPYVHDTFLISRRQDLNRRAKVYMSPSFRLMARTYPFFFVNSATTGAALKRLCRDDAEIALFRPLVKNVFGVDAARRRPHGDGRFRMIAIGTVEPRKNYCGAADIVAALLARGVDAALDVIGRFGWGDDAAALAGRPGVRLLGYQSVDATRSAIENADALICASHDEGLGLPLIEAQYAGLTVIAADLPVFHEVLGSSGVFIDPSRPKEAAGKIVSAISERDSSGASRDALANVARWNAIAERDRAAAIDRLERMHDLVASR